MGGIYLATDKGYYVNLLRKLDIISGGRKDSWARCCSVPTSGRKQRLWMDLLFAVLAVYLDY